MFLLDACVDFERTTYNVRENDRSGSVLAAIILSRPTAIDIPISISTVDIDTSTVGELCVVSRVACCFNKYKSSYFF